MSLASNVTEILEPFIGRTVADTCVRATALSVGKSFDSLGPDDMPALVINIRRLLAPVAPATTIDAIVRDIEGRAA